MKIMQTISPIRAPRHALQQGYRLLALLTIALLLLACNGGGTSPAISGQASPPPDNTHTPTVSAPATIPPSPTVSDPASAPITATQSEKPDVQVAAGGATHPRLFFTADDIPALQERAATTHSEIWQPIQEFAEEELANGIPEPPPSDADQTPYRTAGNRLIALSFACIITERGDYCDLATGSLLDSITWEQWDETETYRDLGHAHMLLGHTLAYDWLYHRLDANEQDLVRRTLATRAQEMYAASSGPRIEGTGNWWRTAFLQNHNWTNHSTLGMAGLALLGEDERAQTWVDHASERVERLHFLLEGIADGSWHEGISYQGYGMTTLLPFLVNLRALQGTDLLPHTYLQNYTYWRLYNYIPESSQFILAFGDFEWEWINGSRSLNGLRFVASEYQNGHAQWLAQEFATHVGRFAGAWQSPWYVFEFLYYDPSVAAQPPGGDLPLARVFPDLEGVIWRTGWQPEDLIFGLKSGPLGGRFAFDTYTQERYPWDPPCVETGCGIHFGHDHDDTNTFYLYRNGQWLVPEHVGNNKSDTRYHNTILIDGQGQYRPSYEVEGKDPQAHIGSDGALVATASTAGFNYVASDATRRYSKHMEGIEDVTRFVLFVRPDYFVILDSLAADAPRTYEWISHIGTDAMTIEENWIRATTEDGQVLGIGTVAPQQFQADVVPGAAESAGDEGEGGEEEHAVGPPSVRITPATPTADTRFVHVLYPTTMSAWGARPTFELLEDSGTTVALRASAGDGSGSSDDILLTYAAPQTMTTAGGYTYNGRVAFVRRSSESALERLFLAGATALTDEQRGQELVSGALAASEPFEAVYQGQTVAVSGAMNGTVKLYAPGIEHLTLNGVAWSFERAGEYILFTP